MAITTLGTDHILTAADLLEALQTMKTQGIDLTQVFLDSEDFRPVTQYHLERCDNPGETTVYRLELSH